MRHEKDSYWWYSRSKQVKVPCLHKRTADHTHGRNDYGVWSRWKNTMKALAMTNGDRLVQGIERQTVLPWRRYGTTPHLGCSFPFSHSPQLQLACNILQFNSRGQLAHGEGVETLRTCLRPAKVHFPVPSWPKPKMEMMEEAGLISCIRLVQW